MSFLQQRTSFPTSVITSTIQILRHFPSVKPAKFCLLILLTTNFRWCLLSVLLNCTPGHVQYDLNVFLMVFYTQKVFSNFMNWNSPELFHNSVYLYKLNVRMSFLSVFTVEALCSFPDALQMGLSVLSQSWHPRIRLSFQHSIPKFVFSLKICVQNSDFFKFL